MLPVSPINGQLATINGINYQYVSADNAWKRMIGGYQTVITTGNVTAAGFNFSNGSPVISQDRIDTYMAPFYTYANIYYGGLGGNNISEARAWVTTMLFGG